MSTVPTETIYVVLLNEGAAALRAVQAVRRAGDTFQIVSKNDAPEEEQWQFSSGSVVRCEERLLSGVVHWAAIEAVPPRTLRLV